MERSTIPALADPAPATPCRLLPLLAGALLVLFSRTGLSQTPVIDRVLPAFGPASGTGLVIVSGSGFAAGATVTFGGVAATSVSVTNANALTARPPVHAAGPVTVAVTNPNTQTGSLASAYKYLAPSGAFAIGFFAISVPDVFVTDITAGPDGYLWFLTNGGESLDPDGLGKMTTGGTFTAYPLTANGLLRDIAPGPDGNLWYVRKAPDMIGRATTSGATTEYSNGSGKAYEGITAGPDGAVWFTENFANLVGRITTSGSITEFLVHNEASGITLGPDGALWLAGCQSNAPVCTRLLPNGQFLDLPIPNPVSGDCPQKIVAGPDGNLWFQYSGRTSVGRLSTAGAYAEFAVPSGLAIHDIAAGVDGNLWITYSDFVDAWVGRITPSGKVTEFPLPVGSVPRGIVPGPDGALWFADGYDVGRINPGALSPAALSVDSASSAGTTSNANGVLEAGETVLVKPSWSNIGAAPIALTGAASAPDGPAGAVYGLPDAAANYGSIAGGSIGNCGSNCYEFSVSNPVTRPAPHWDATFTETPGTGDPPKVWTLHVGRSFSDVPTSSPVYRFVENLFHNGVTGGCGGGNYCPGNLTNRAQMAVFLLVSKEGPFYAPLPAEGTAFADVPASNPFAKWIEELARRGVTAGCGGGNYCPGASVTRAQMSVFLLVTLEGSGYTPPPAVGTFGDVPVSNPFAKWIEELARRGVTAGCGGGNYCPDAAITRGQMAVFLSTTFGLSLYGSS